MERLSSINALIVSQKKEWGEILTGFETKNKYVVLDSSQRRFSLLRRIYSVFNNSGEEIFQLFGPILHPWTFEIRKNNIEYGKITKKWSGLLKESFTHADNFGVTFPTEWDITQKALFLGAVFLIDFAHFENKGNR